MPFKSKSQQRYFYAHRQDLAKQGVDVDEWSRETDFKHLPERAKSASWATEYFKFAAMSLATRDRLLDVGGTLFGSVGGGILANQGLHAYDPGVSPEAALFATGTGALVGGGIGKTLALHAAGHRAPPSVAHAILGLPDAATAARYEALPPTALVARAIDKVAEVSPSDLKHGTDPDSKFDPKQLALGVKIEHEHTDNPAVAKAITKAHLSEFPEYNTALKKMEKAAYWATEYFSAQK